MAGAIFGEVGLPLLVAGAAFGDVAVSLFVAGAAFGGILKDFGAPNKIIIKGSLVEKLPSYGDLKMQRVQ